MMKQMAPDATYQIRLPVVGRMFIVGFTVLVVGFVLSSLAFALSTGEGVDLGAAIFITLAFAVFPTWLGLRIFRLGIYCEPSTLTIRNFLHTRRIDWSEIESFRVGRPPNHLWGMCVVVLLNSDEVIFAEGTSRARGWEPGGESARRLATLRGFLGGGQ